MDDKEIDALVEQVLKKATGKIEAYPLLSIMASDATVAKHVAHHNSDNAIASMVVENHGYARKPGEDQLLHTARIWSSIPKGVLHFVRYEVSRQEVAEHLKAVDNRVQQHVASINQSRARKAAEINRQIKEEEKKTKSLKARILRRSASHLEEIARLREKLRFLGAIDARSLENMPAHVSFDYHEAKLVRHLQGLPGDKMHILLGYGRYISEDTMDSRLSSEAIEMAADKNTIDNVVRLLNEEPGKVVPFLKALHTRTKFVLPDKESPEAKIYERAALQHDSTDSEKRHHTRKVNAHRPFCKVREVKLIDRAK